MYGVVKVKTVDPFLLVQPLLAAAIAAADAAVVLLALLLLLPFVGLPSGV